MKIAVSLPMPALKPLSLPKFQWKNFFRKAVDLPSVMFDSIPISFSESKFKAPAGNFAFSRFSRKFRSFLPKLLMIAGVIVVIGLIVIFLSRAGQGSTLATAKTSINQSFEVTARDKDGRSLNRSFPVNVTSAEKVSSVLIQGKRYKAREGKQFLLLNYEMDNSDKVVYYSNPTDLFRYLRSDGKKFAPTVHQGIVQVRPDSTKNSNVGFVIDANANNFTVELGDLDGQRQAVEIKF